MGIGGRLIGDSGGGRILCSRKDGDLARFCGRCCTGAAAGAVPAERSWEGEPVRCCTMLRKSFLLML